MFIVIKEDRVEDWKIQCVVVSIGMNLVVDVLNFIIDNGWKGGKYLNEYNYSYSYFNMGMIMLIMVLMVLEELK